MLSSIRVVYWRHFEDFVGVFFGGRGTEVASRLCKCAGECLMQLESGPRHVIVWTELSLCHSATSMDFGSSLLCLHLYTFIHLTIVAFVHCRLTLALLLLYSLHCQRFILSLIHI